MSNRSYLQIHRYHKSRLSNIESNEPIDIRPVNYNQQYLRLKNENDEIQKEIFNLKREIEIEEAKGKSDYDTLELEIEDLMDKKVKEHDQLTQKLQEIKEKISELDEWSESTFQIDARIEELKKQDAEVTEQERLFCDELKSLTKLFRSLSDNEPLSADEIFKQKTPKYKKSTPASAMSSSLFKLRQVLISLYAKSVREDPSCAVQ